MKSRNVFPIVALLLMFLLVSPIAATENAVKIRVDDGRTDNRVAFYYVYGDHIEWWQGGAKFIFGTGTDEYKIVEEFMLALPDTLGMKVLAGEIHLIGGYLKGEYAFSGIIEFKDYMFIDNDGLIIIEWEHQKSLNVTIYAKTAVNLTASEIGGYGFADWEQKVVGYMNICIPMVGCKVRPIYDDTPTTEIPTGDDVLVIPVEGTVLTVNYRGYDQYLGGGPNLKKNVDKSRTISGGMIFWDREPDYWLVYDAKGLSEVWKVNNWFNEAVWIWPTPHKVAVEEVR